jgi:hypothetical protein
MIVLTKVPFANFVGASKNSLGFKIDFTSSAEIHCASLLSKFSTSLLLVLACLISRNHIPSEAAPIEVAIAFHNDPIFLL